MILARRGGEGRGIGIVWNNDYRNQLAAKSRLHVICLNKAHEALGGGIGLQRGFTRADTRSRIPFAAAKCMSQRSRCLIGGEWSTG